MAHSVVCHFDCCYDVDLSTKNIFFYFRMMSNLKNDIELLAESVFAAFRFMIPTADWLAVKDKAAIVRKLNSIKFYSGIPEWMVDDDAVERHTPPYDPTQTRFMDYPAICKTK